MKKATRKSKAPVRAKRATKPVAAAKKPARAGAKGKVFTPPSLSSYSEALQKAGFLTGAAGRQKVSEDVAPILRALHEVLAGGTLSTAPVVAGDIHPGVTARLDRLAQSLVREINRVRKISPVAPAYG